MRSITKLTIALLAVAVLVSVAIPVSAASGCSTGTQSASGFAALKAPSSKNYLEYNKLMYEVVKTRNNVKGYIANTTGIQGFATLPGVTVRKTMTHVTGRNWYITITISNIPAQVTRLNVIDYLFNLNDPSNFSRSPTVAFDGVIQWNNIPVPASRTVTLTFNAQQIYPGYVSDQGYVSFFTGTRIIPVDIEMTNLPVGFNRALTSMDTQNTPCTRADA